MAKETRQSSSWRSLFLSVFVVILSVVLFDFFAPPTTSPQFLSLPPYQQLSYKDQEGPVYFSQHVELFRNDTISPESYAVDKRGFMYASMKDGTLRKLWNFRNGTHEFEIIARPASVNLTAGEKLPPLSYCTLERSTFAACGVPLGLRYYDEGDREILLLVEAYHGVIEVDLKDYSMKRLVKAGVNGEAIKMFNSAVKRDGVVYFTTSSEKYPYHQHQYDIFEIAGNGGLYSYHTKTKQLKKLLNNLFFGNGIEFSRDGEHLFLAETSAARIRRFNLKTGKDDFLIDGLACLPDNLKYSPDKQRLWVGCATPVNLMYTFTAKHPSVRAFITKLPFFFWVLDHAHVGSQVFTVDEEQRKIGAFLVDPKETFIAVSEAFEHDGFVYVGFFAFNAIVRMPLPPSLKH